MTTQSKIILSALFVVAVVGGGSYYIITKNLDQFDQNMNKLLEYNENNLPEKTIQKNILNKGFLKSSGTYTMINESKEPFKVIVNYNLHHGLDYLLSKKITFTASTEVTVKDVKITNPIKNSALIESYGVIDNNQSIVINNGPFDMNTIKSTEGMVFSDKINVGSSVVNINLNKDEVITTGSIIRQQTYLNNRMLSDMHNMNIKYVSTLTDAIPKEIDLSLNKYNAIPYSFQNASVKMIFKKENEKYNIESNVKIDNIKFSFLPYPFVLNSESVLVGINKEFVSKATNYDAKSAKENLIKQFKNGFSLRLTKFDLTPIGVNSSIKFKAALDAAPVNSIAEVKPSKQMSSSVSISTTGAFTKEALSIYQDLDLISQGNYEHLDNNEVNLLLNYKDENLLVNNKLSNDSPALTLFSKYFQVFDQIVLMK